MPPFPCFLVATILLCSYTPTLQVRKGRRRALHTAEHTSVASRWVRARHILLRALLAGVVVALMGEISINPFGTAFRFSLGPMALALLALFNWLPPYLAGAAAGLVVPVVHGVVAFIGDPNLAAADVFGAMQSYIPETLAYSLLGTLYFLFRVGDRIDTPLRVTALLALADVTVNVVEMTVRGGPLLVRPLTMMLLVAVGRAVVALGAYYILQEGVRQRQWAKERKSYMERLLFASNLQTEAFFLQKSSREIEQIMAKAHSLYRDLAGQPGQSLALDIAKDIHEVKKDYQRTLSALYRLVGMPTLEPEMDLGEIVALVFDANATYAQSLGKEIQLVGDMSADFRTPRYGRWVSILNNLVSNAVEACGQQGTVTVGTARLHDRFVLEISDTGCGIPREDWELIFSPGFSTKLNPVTGAFSSGIGLTHVAGLARAMDGSIWVARSGPTGTRFRLEVPWSSLEAVADKE